MSTLIMFFLLNLLACNKEPTNPQAADEIVFFNGKIYTVNPTQIWAEAIYVEKGIIRYVGSNEETQSRASETAEFIDLEGSLMMPGIHDVHMHPLEAMSPLGVCFLDSEEDNPENFISELAACQSDRPKGLDWVFGFGHSIFTMFEAERPPVEILDEAIPDRPAIMMEETSHSLWVNTKALETVGIDANSPNPQGGIIFKDPDTGKPEGLLLDAAGDFLLDKFWTPTPEIKELNYQGLLEALDLLTANGITSVCEGRTYWRRDFEEAWLRAEEEGDLSVRVVLGLWGYPHLDDEEQLTELKKRFRNDPNKLVRINQIKLYSDGIIPNTTAAMHEPYQLDLGILPENKGLNYFTQSRMQAYIAELEKTGFDFHIHAIGDRGVHETLNAIEAARRINGELGARHRLTHLEVVNPTDYPRFRKLNVTADCQVAGDFTQPENWTENKTFIGDRADVSIPIKDFYKAGARLTLSSDWDVSDLNPFVGIQNAVTRSPQAISLEEAIKAYTINAAYVMRQEDKVGSIEVGKEADLIILDRNIFEIPLNQINQTKVLETYLGGELIYER